MNKLNEVNIRTEVKTMAQIDYSQAHGNGNWEVSWCIEEGKFTWFFNDEFGALPTHEEVERVCRAMLGYMSKITEEERLHRNEWASCQWYIQNMGRKITEKFDNLLDFKASPHYQNYLKTCQPAYLKQLAAERALVPSFGYIYLIKAETGHYKIGRTKQLDKRLNLFGVKLPFKIALVHAIPAQNYIEAEKQLHKLFESKRLEGEWFDLSFEEIEHIKQIEAM